MREYTPLLLFLLLLPYGLAYPECQREQLQKDVPCTIISSYLPANGCNSTLYIYNGTGGEIQSKKWGALNPFCNVTWNITEVGTYAYNSTIEDGAITILTEDEMISLGVVIFVVLINIALFLLPLWVRFTEKDPLNNLIKKMVWIAGLAVLAFNTTIIVSMADNAGLGINSELFLYQQIFLWSIFIAMIFLFWNMMTTTLSMYKLEKQRKMMGEND